jgi:hypothetical protein
MLQTLMCYAKGHMMWHVDILKTAHLAKSLM